MSHYKTQAFLKSKSFILQTQNILSYLPTNPIHKKAMASSNHYTQT